MTKNMESIKETKAMLEEATILLKEQVTLEIKELRDFTTTYV